MYHMQYSHPDIAQAVRDLVRHMTRGDETHMQAMLRCMQYLKCTKDAGLFLKPERKWDGKDDFYFKINGRSDSDYAKDTQTRHSISGYIVGPRGAIHVNHLQAPCRAFLRWDLSWREHVNVTYSYVNSTCFWILTVCSCGLQYGSTKE
jgi:hypothetical protein